MEIASGGLQPVPKNGSSMNPEEIPIVLKNILDDSAGRVHSANGAVMTALAKILTEYKKILETEDNKCSP
mgnify:CR=1 FL=1